MTGVAPRGRRGFSLGTGRPAGCPLCPVVAVGRQAVTEALPCSS